MCLVSQKDPCNKGEKQRRKYILLQANWPSLLVDRNYVYTNCMA